MFQAIVDIEFCYGHRLVGHEGKCKFLHGHSGLITLYFETQNLQEGQQDMVIDFGVAKRQAKAWIDETLDHTLLLHKADPLIELLEATGERFLALEQRPTAEVIAQYVFSNLRRLGLPISKVALEETTSARAVYWEKV